MVNWNLIELTLVIADGDASKLHLTDKFMAVLHGANVFSTLWNLKILFLNSLRGKKFIRWHTSCNKMECCGSRFPIVAESILAHYPLPLRRLFG